MADLDDRREPGVPNVVHIISRMNVGGPAWLVTVLTAGLPLRGFPSQLVVGDVAANEADFVELRGAEVPMTRVAGLGRSIRPWDDLRALITLVKFLRRERPTIVHTHTSKAGVLGRLAARLGRVPIVVHTFHGHLLHGYFSGLRVRLVVLVEKILARSSSALIAVGEPVRADLLAAGIGRKKPFVVIGPGVRDVAQRDREEVRREWNVPSNGMVVLFVGRLTAVKRVDRLAEAFRSVHARHPETVLVIVGGGDLAIDLERRLADLPEAVRMVGWCSDAPALYGAADVVVLTSDNEGMPVSLIEAQMAGVPVVSTRVGGVADVVDDGVTGLLVDVTPDAVADGIVRLLDDGELRRQMGMAARERALLVHSIDRFLDRHADLYRRLTTNPSSVDTAFG